MFVSPNTLEICVDASLITINDRVFTCSGAVCLETYEDIYLVTPDSTNNKGELLAVYLGCQMAIKYRLFNNYDKIHIYSDSQFAVLGLRDWMEKWITTTDEKGVIYNSSSKPVKNYQLFQMIISYCVTNNLIVNLYNQKGHVNTNSEASMAQANKQFKDANGILLGYDDLKRITDGNNYIDLKTKQVLQSIIPTTYRPIIHTEGNIQMVHYAQYDNFKKFIK